MQPQASCRDLDGWRAQRVLLHQGASGKVQWNNPRKVYTLESSWEGCIVKNPLQDMYMYVRWNLAVFALSSKEHQIPKVETHEIGLIRIERTSNRSTPIWNTENGKESWNVLCMHILSHSYLCQMPESSPSGTLTMVTCPPKWLWGTPAIPGHGIWPRF